MSESSHPNFDTWACSNSLIERPGGTVRVGIIDRNGEEVFRSICPEPTVCETCGKPCVTPHQIADAVRIAQREEVLAAYELGRHDVFRFTEQVNFRAGFIKFVVFAGLVIGCWWADKSGDFIDGVAWAAGLGCLWAVLQMLPSSPRLFFWIMDQQRVG